MLNNLMYLFCPENSCTGIPESLLVQNASRGMQATKTLLWVSVAVVLSIGISQLV